MSRKDNPARDPFTFSLGGTTAIASFFPPFAIADDRIRKIVDRRPANAGADASNDADAMDGAWRHGQGRAA